MAGESVTVYRRRRVPASATATSSAISSSLPIFSYIPKSESIFSSNYQNQVPTVKVISIPLTKGTHYEHALTFDRHRIGYAAAEKPYRHG